MFGWKYRSSSFTVSCLNWQRPILPLRNVPKCLKDGITYTHDNNGNIISRTGIAGTTTYEYDQANRLRKVTMPDGSISEYKYDALWRRTEKAVTVNNTTTTTRYLYDGLAILGEYDGNNASRTKYTHDSGVDLPLSMERSGQSYYYHRDALGSITTITDWQANLVQQYQYDAFGKITDQMNVSFVQSFTFTGREYDPETGLHYYRFRYYDPQIGRFISEDPIGFLGGDVNFFAYVGNNAVRHIDPYGLWLKDTAVHIGDVFGYITDASGSGGYYGAAIGGAVGGVFGGIPLGIVGGFAGGFVGGLFDPAGAGELNYHEPVPPITPRIHMPPSDYPTIHIPKPTPPSTIPMPQPTIHMPWLEPAKCH